MGWSCPLPVSLPWFHPEIEGRVWVGEHPAPTALLGHCAVLFCLTRRLSPVCLWCPTPSALRTQDSGGKSHVLSSTLSGPIHQCVAGWKPAAPLSSSPAPDSCSAWGPPTVGVQREEMAGYTETEEDSCEGVFFLKFWKLNCFVGKELMHL